MNVQTALNLICERSNANSSLGFRPALACRQIRLLLMGHLQSKAKEEIDQLREENKRLREALESCTGLCENYQNDESVECEEPACYGLSKAVIKVIFKALKG